MRAPALQISVARLSEGGLDYAFHLGEDWFARWQAEDPDLEFAGPGDLSVRVRLERHGHDILVRGQLEGTLTLSCSRCLTPFSYPVAADFDLLLAPGPVSVDDKEVELTREDLDLDFYERETVDVERILREQVLLQFPLKPLCAETCRGICPRCGADLNRETCNCAVEESTSPFAILKKIKL